MQYPNYTNEILNMNYKLVAIKNNQTQHLQDLYFQIIGAVPYSGYKNMKIVNSYSRLFITTPNGSLYFRPDITRQDIVSICTKQSGVIKRNHSLYLLWKRTFKGSPQWNDEYGIVLGMQKQLIKLIRLKVTELPSFIIELIRYGPNRGQMINKCYFMMNKIYYMNKLGGKHWQNFLLDIQDYEVIPRYLPAVIGMLAQSLLINNIPVKNFSKLHSSLIEIYAKLPDSETFQSIVDKKTDINFKDTLDELISKGLLQLDITNKTVYKNIYDYIKRTTDLLFNKKYSIYYLIREQIKKNSTMQ